MPSTSQQGYHHYNLVFVQKLSISLEMKKGRDFLSSKQERIQTAKDPSANVWEETRIEVLLDQGLRLSTHNFMISQLGKRYVAESAPCFETRFAQTN